VGVDDFNENDTFIVILPPTGIFLKQRLGRRLMNRLQLLSLTRLITRGKVESAHLV